MENKEQTIREVVGENVRRIQPLVNAGLPLHMTMGNHECSGEATTLCSTTSSYGNNPNYPTDAMRGTYYQQVAQLVDSWPYVEMVAIHALTKATEPASGLVNTDGSATQSWTSYKVAADADD